MARASQPFAPIIPCDNLRNRGVIGPGEGKPFATFRAHGAMCGMVGVQAVPGASWVWVIWPDLSLASSHAGGSVFDADRIVCWRNRPGPERKSCGANQPLVLGHAVIVVCNSRCVAKNSIVLVTLS